ncbi:MAG: LytR C-terminal domain-containing protein [Actinomycetaceae bacterium]|nr:LytR C-terminal domain-containing protein [Actinomycetaceae bacterium]MDY6082474.1 LytR C-terminal domain-containing protein [Actinomycetaceae bacterium]
MANVSPENSRERYQRRIQQRQTIIFGSMAALLIIMLVAALLVWSGIVPAPITRNFSEGSTRTNLNTPCIAAGTKPVEPAEITVNVYNSTSRAGLAESVSAELKGRKIIVGKTGNWSGQNLAEPARFIVGAQGVAAAYTLAQYVPDSVIEYSPDEASATVTMVLGAGYESLMTADQMKAANPDGVLTPIEGCTVNVDAKAS